jgi:hypothetical protein
LVPGEYDDDDDFEYEDDDQGEPERTPREWADLRRARKAKDKAERELASLRRQMAFRDAGISPDDPKFSYFVKGYDGEVSAEAIRAEALKAGFLTEEKVEEGSREEIAAAGRITDVAQGAVPAGYESADTIQLDEAFRTGGVEGMLQFLAQKGIPINSHEQ